MERFVNLRFPLAVALSVCLGITTAYFFTFSLIFWGVVFALLFAGALAFYFLPYKNGDTLKTKLIFSLIFIVVFAFSGANFNFSVRNFENADLDGHTYEVTGSVKEVMETESGVRLLLEDLTVDGNIRAKLKYNAYLYVFDGADFDLGYKLKFTTKFTDNHSIYEGRLSSYNLLRKVKYTASLSASQIQTLEISPSIFQKANIFLRESLSQGLTGDQFGLAYALLTGHSEFIEQETLESYRMAGVAHIFAVSGLHIGFLAVAFGWLLTKLRVGRVARVLVIFPLLLFYSGVCGFSASSIRATIMVTVGLLTAIKGRRYDGLSSISASAVIILLFNPLQLFYVGFQLSFVVVLGVLLLAQPIAKLFKFLPAKLSTALGTVLSAQLSAIPISLSAFGYFSLISVAVNLIFIPFVSVLFITLMVLTIVGGIFSISYIILFPMSYLLMVVNACINAFDYSAFIVGGVVMGGFALTYYLCALISSGIINLNRVYKSISIVVCAVITVVGTLGLNIYENRLTKVYVCGTENVCATVIKTEKDATLIVSDVNYVYSVGRLKRLNSSGVTHLNNVIIMNGYGVDLQVFLTKLRTAFTLDRIFYYGEQKLNQETAVNKSFPNLKVFAIKNDGVLPNISFDCAYALDGRVVGCKLSTVNLAVFSRIDNAKPLDGLDKYDMVVCGYLHERVFAKLSPKTAISYLSSAVYTDAESTGNLVYKFK